MLLPILKDPDDLTARLKQATEPKNEGANPIDFETPVNEEFIHPEDQAARPKQSDFSPLIDVEQPIVEEKPQQPERPPLSILDARLQATTYVNLFDSLEQLFLPNLYEGKLFNPLEKKRRDQIQESIKKSTTTELSESDLLLIEKVEKLIAYVKKLPLSDTEKETIISPLADLLQSSNKQLSPGWALIIATVTVMLPRLLPFININFDFLDISSLTNLQKTA